MQLPEKLETSYGCLIAVFESPLIFKHFEKKDERHSQSISDVIESQRRVHLHR